MSAAELRAQSEQAAAQRARRDRNAERPRLRRAVFALALLAGSAATAHNLAPAYLELRERADGEVEVAWKQSAVVPRGVRLEPVLPCPDAAPRSARLTDDAVVFAWRLACDGSLVGRRVEVRGLAGSGVDTVVRIALADGREVRAILHANAPALIVPERERAAAVFASYARLGAEHLATGLDHVLFVAGLALLLGATRRLLVAVTAFTLGHSATLALAALGVVAPPQAPVEVAIAATIVALALALARATAHGPPARAATNPTGGKPVAGSRLGRSPALLPFAFGLLHGLGFAGALADLGLPQHAIPLALFAFNLGIELGQLAVVALLLAALALAARVPIAAWPRVARAARELPATAIGALGVFWCLERAAALLFP